MADKTIDIRGQTCPVTLVLTRQALNEMSAGQVLEVLVDFKPAVETTIPSYCQKKGYPIETLAEGENQWRLRIEKREP
jgi:tRNA 2-thiouridine synthesizing protein A